MYPPKPTIEKIIHTVLHDETPVSCDGWEMKVFPDRYDSYAVHLWNYADEFLLKIDKRNLSKKKYSTAFPDGIERTLYVEKIGFSDAPHIWVTDTTNDDTRYCIQSFTRGIPLSEYLGDPDFESLAKKLAELHSIHPTTPSWGSTQSGNPFCGKHATLAEYVEKRTMLELDKSDTLKVTEIDTLKAGVSRVMANLDLANISPCLVHNDCHDGNMIMDDRGTIHLIDFCDIAYVLPEHDFARMMTHDYFKKHLSVIMHLYEKQSGRHLDPQLLDFFLLLRLVYQIRKLAYPERWQEYWESVQNILQKY